MTAHRGPSDDVVERIFASWLPGAMFPSELLWLERMIRRANVEVVIECGRQDGVSTWTLATLLRDAGTRILSIDFDDDKRQLEAVRSRVAGLDVECVSGDIHREVPRLLAELAGRRVAVVQDGPKGWEGLATLLAAGFEANVSLIAQHNLHIGHVTRTIFQMLALRPAFLEAAEPEDGLLRALRDRETVGLRAAAPNRPVDHTSLGVIRLDEPARAHLFEATRLLRRSMWPWDPRTVRRHWDRGDFDYCSRVRSRSRFTPLRFKRR